MDLKDKIVIVTGASQGLGREVSLKLSHAGAKVMLVARSKELLDSVRKTIESAGGAAQVYMCDVRNPEQIKKTVDEIVKIHNHIDILINNAGIWTDEDLEKENPERRRLALETNTLGPIEFTKAVLPYMQKLNRGFLFFVISTSAVSDNDFGNNKDWQTYGSSKWAMRGFAKDLKNSLRDTNIRVSTLFPGGFDSNLYENAGWKENTHKQPWMMKATDVADLVIFMLTRPADMLIDTLIATKFTTK
jgi:NADP-dependent 3-hydroxy acid dehydrogenase YdfG